MPYTTISELVEEEEDTPIFTGYGTPSLDYTYFYSPGEHSDDWYIGDEISIDFVNNKTKIPKNQCQYCGKKKQNLKKSKNGLKICRDCEGAKKILNEIYYNNLDGIDKIKNLILNERVLEK